MVTRKLVRLAVLGAVCVAPSACATTRYSRGGVATLPPGVKGKAGSNAVLEIERLKVRVESLDYAKQEAAIPPFTVRLVFDPRELGYSFDPRQVTLRAADGSTWKPRVHGPGQFLTGPWSCSGAGIAADDTQGYHILAPGSCFELAFEVPLAGEARFALELGGLARGQRRLDPIRLAFARREGRSLDRVYWLEAVLAPLALAGGGM